jgi:hypothetical protein
MRLVIPSLKDDQFGNVFVESKTQKDMFSKLKWSIIIHLVDRYDNHIAGYSLIRLNNDGLMRFKNIHSDSDRSHKSLTRIDLDREKKLLITEVDVI